MLSQEVYVTFDVECQGTPRYRVWVNQELFTERRWRFDPDQYLTENLVIRTQPGRYHLRAELVPGDIGEITVTNFQVESGQAQVNQQGFLEIIDETT